MKKALAVFMIAALLIGLSACAATQPVTPDYADAASFEAALNAGTDVTGKIVQFTVDKLVPDSAFGYNMEAGEHLNFCSATNPGVSEGDTVTVEVKEVVSSLGSYIISYKMK